MRNPHNLLIAMLKDQDSLQNREPMNTTYGELGAGSVVHPPAVFTKTHNEDGSCNIKIGQDCRIDSMCKLEGGQGLTLGNNVHIASFAHINIGGGRTIIHDGAAVASGGRIISGGNAPDSVSCSASAALADQVLHTRLTVLQRNSVVYAGAMVMPGVTLGEGSRLLPGGVATQDIPAFQIWGGVPAKFIRDVKIP